MGISLASKVSLFRLLLIPFFLGCLLYYRPGQEGLRYAALGLFLAGVLSDAVDGYIARAKTQWTRLGAFLDPLADKLLLLTAFLSLALIRTIPDDLRLPAWVVIAFISRECIIVLGSGLLYHLTGTLEIQPSRLGKWATFLQMLVVLAVLSRWPYAPWVWRVAVVLMIASAVVYVRRGVRLLNSSVS